MTAREGPELPWDPFTPDELKQYRAARRDAELAAEPEDEADLEAPDFEIEFVIHHDPEAEAGS
jgi:hypothetical protein